MWAYKFIKFNSDIKNYEINYEIINSWFLEVQHIYIIIPSILLLNEMHLGQKQIASKIYNRLRKQKNCPIASNNFAEFHRLMKKALKDEVWKIHEFKFYSLIYLFNVFLCENL